MDVLAEEYDADESRMSSSAENNSLSDDDQVESPPRGGIVKHGDWFALGMDYALLKVLCLAMMREFHREPKTEGTKSRSLAERVEDANYHANKWNLNEMSRSPRVISEALKREVERWCSVATLFMQNRMSHLHLEAFGDKLPAEDEIDTKRKWPPADLPETWFDFEKSFELLCSSRDALIHECTLNNIRLPGNCRGEEEAIDFYTDAGMPLMDYARKVKSRTRTDSCVKNYWRRMVVYHMEDLLEYYSEMACVNKDSV